MIGNCIIEAYRLQLANNDQGKVYYVPRMGDKSVGHAYYVKDPADLEALALNQADNGFPQFPQLTVRQVLEHHDPKYLSLSID